MAQDTTIDDGYIVLGTHTVAVEQRGKEAITRPDGSIAMVPFCELAYVQSSRVSYYDARLHEELTLIHLRMLERAHMRASASVQANEKWCAGCGDFRGRSYFSPKPDAHDGLHPHCKECRAAHQRRLYALQRAEEGREVRAYRRKEHQVIEVDFAPLKVEKAA